MATGNTTSYSFEIEKMFNRADKKQAYYFQPAPKHLSTFQTGHCILPFMAIIQFIHNPDYSDFLKRDWPATRPKV